MTKQKMIASLQEKIRRLHEEKIVAELTKGWLQCVAYIVEMVHKVRHLLLYTYSACLVSREWIKEEKEEQ